MKELLLSIIIPTYNAEKYIIPCLNSIFKQGLDNEEFEVLLVDDGCTDKTLSLVESYQKKYSNIYIIHQKNQGPASARNNGMKHAKGKYILFIDSDDLLIENSIRTMLEIATANSLDILKSKITTIDNIEVEKGNYPKSVIWNGLLGHLSKGQEGFVRAYDPNESYVFMNLFRRDFVIQNKIQFIDGLFFVEDVIFTILCYLKAQRFMEIPYTHYVYRRNETSIMSTMSKRKLCDANTVIESLYQLSKNMSLSKEGKRKLNDTIFACFSVVLWYLSHYTSLYPQRKVVIGDLKKKCPNLSFNNDMKQRITTFFYKYMPSLYISFRYFTAKRKYNQ